MKRVCKNGQNKVKRINRKLPIMRIRSKVIIAIEN